MLSIHSFPALFYRLLGHLIFSSFSFISFHRVLFQCRAVNLAIAKHAHCLLLNASKKKTCTLCYVVTIQRWRLLFVARTIGSPFHTCLFWRTQPKNVDISNRNQIALRAIRPSLYGTAGWMRRCVSAPVHSADWRCCDIAAAGAAAAVAIGVTSHKLAGTPTPSRKVGQAAFADHRERRRYRRNNFANESNTVIPTAAAHHVPYSVVLLSPRDKRTRGRGQVH